jgi:uncharacterized protein YkwD
MRAMSTHPRARVSRLALVAAFTALVTLGGGSLANPAPANAGTAETMEAYLLKWINNARANRGVPRLALRVRIIDLAGDRATAMASRNDLYHANCLACSLRNRGVSFKRCGEVIAYTTYPWGYEAARSIFNGWKRSSTHWGILMSRSYNRIGIGVAHRKSNGSTWAAAILVG